MIGYSYYPKWHYDENTGIGGIEDLEETLDNTANAYGKPVVVVETGFASRGVQFEPDYEFDVSQAGQQQFLATVVDTVQQVPSGLGSGVFWWYPEAVPMNDLGVWEGGRYGLFDQNKELLPAADVFEQFLPSGLTGDYNGNDMIDAADYTVWRDAMTAGSTSLTNDPTPGTVDESDFLYWRDHFGEVLGGGRGRGRFSDRRASSRTPHGHPGRHADRLRPVP